MTDSEVMQQALDALHAMQDAMLDMGVPVDPAHPNRMALNYGCTARHDLTAQLLLPAEAARKNRITYVCPVCAASLERQE